MKKYFNTVLNDQGDAVQDATITVQDLYGNTATIYSTNAGATITSALLTDQYGYFEFYAKDGRYSITISKDGMNSRTIQDVLIEEGGVATIAALRALPPPSLDGDELFIGGYYARGDGGGGTFYWDSASTDADDAGITILPTGHTGAGRWKRSYSGAVNVKWFGATGDGVTDDTTAFTSAISAGSDVFVPDVSVRYRVTNTLTPTGGQSIIGARSKPELKLDSASVALLFNLDSVDRATITNLTLDGNKTTTPTDEFISMDSSTYCAICDCVINNAPSAAAGSILLSGTATNNLIENNEFSASEGTAIGLSGTSCTGNRIARNTLQSNGAFGIRLGEGANKNDISFNKTTSTTIELIGITSDCYHNRVIGNHAEGSGDNGISISGYQNVVMGNVCVNNQKAGIWCWGSFNTVDGNICLNNNLENSGNNWAGIGASANYGGTGQHNVIVGNYCDDDQASPTQWNGVRLAGSSYTLWAAGQSITSGEYRYYGLNVYQATTSGTTGATAPTHTTGDVSDGTVTWRYKRTFLTTADAVYNIVANNTVPRFQSAAYFATDNWANNSLIGKVDTDYRVSGSYRIGVGASGAMYVNVGGTDKYRFTSTEFRPESDVGVSLGLTNRRWSSVYSNAYYSGASGATTQVVGARVTGFTTAAGSANKDASAINVGTITATDANLQAIAAWAKALHDAMATHGLIGA